MLEGDLPLPSGHFRDAKLINYHDDDENDGTGYVLFRVMDTVLPWPQMKTWVSVVYGFSLDEAEEYLSLLDEAEKL